VSKTKYNLTSAISLYTFDSLGDSLRRLTKWEESGLITEREYAKFIIQLFHQIPEELYNDIINET
jgi:hypothetical protein